ncbi:MAG: cell envelope integrity protein TolA [Alphaproteobacteria bacterium]|nr:cell envelope integrity protein TolA [Alphaproteobacteria bacterium]
MEIKTPFLISVALHGAMLLLTYVNMNGFFSRKVNDKGYVVFDYVEIGKTSKAPVLSKEEGKASKTKAKSETKEIVNHKTQPAESVKHEDKQERDQKKEVPIKKKQKMHKGNKKKAEKKAVVTKKEDKKSRSNDKAVVNLRKSKKAKNADPKAAKKSFDSILDSASAKGDNENSGVKAEEVGEVLTATQIDLIRQTIRKCWHFPAGLRNAEDLIVDIKMELDPEGNVKKAEIVDKTRMANDHDYRTAAENAYRAVLDPKCNPLPLPKEHYNEWKDLELSFNPKEMFE